MLKRDNVSLYLTQQLSGIWRLKSNLYTSEVISSLNAGSGNAPGYNAKVCMEKEEKAVHLVCVVA